VYIIVFKKNDYIFFGPNILKEGWRASITRYKQ
jgi:hypothetical protein